MTTNPDESKPRSPETIFSPKEWPYPRVPISVEQVEAARASRRGMTNDDGRRGAILLPAYRNDPAAPFLRGQLDFDLLRQSLLYWDMVVWPQAELFDPMTVPFEELLSRFDHRESWQAELEREGALDVMQLAVSWINSSPRPLTTVDAWQFNESVYRSCEYWAPGQWALAQYGGRFHRPGPELRETEGAMGSLVSLLPCPAQGVAYLQIVEFRRKNLSALRELRVALDDLNIEIVRNPESAFAANHAHNRLDQALEAVWKYAHEQQLAPRRSTLRAMFAAAESGFHGLLAADGLAPLLHLPLASAAALMATAGAVAGAGLHFARDRFADPLHQGRGVAGYILEAVKQGVVSAPP